MIKNDKQYQITKNKLKEFEQTLQQIQELNSDELSLRLNQNAIESQIEELKEELEEYEYLKKNETNTIHSSLENFPELLIKARISNGWTQAELAEKIGIKEQQIQRYEACNYSTASFPKIISIAGIVGLRVDEIKAKLKGMELLVEGVDPNNIRQAKEKLRAKQILLNI